MREQLPSGCCGATKCNFRRTNNICLLSGVNGEVVYAHPGNTGELTPFAINNSSFVELDVHPKRNTLMDANVNHRINGFKAHVADLQCYFVLLHRNSNLSEMVCNVSVCLIHKHYSHGKRLTRHQVVHFNSQLGSVRSQSEQWQYR